MLKILTDNFRLKMRGWQRERARHVRKRFFFRKKEERVRKDKIKEVLFQENQQQIGHKTKALVNGKKSLHQPILLILFLA